MAAPSGAQGTAFRRYGKALSSVTVDAATGTVTRGARPANRTGTTIADFDTLDLGGFVGVDSGNGFCEWFDAGIKGFRGNHSDLMNSILFAYCSAKLDPRSGGPGGSVKLGFYEGYTVGGTTPTTAVAVLTLTGLPGNTASSSFFGGFRCFFVRVFFDPLVAFRDGQIGYSWGFLDTGTNVGNPLGGVLAGTWPFVSVGSSASGGNPQGLDNVIDRYCPPGTLRSMFSFGTTSGTFLSMEMAIEEVADQASTVQTVNSMTFPNPDVLTADTATVGQSWTATVTLGLTRNAASTWLLYFGGQLVNPPNGIPAPTPMGGLNFGSGKAGKMLLCALNTQGSSVMASHTGVSGSSSSSSPVAIPAAIALVDNHWCAQAIVLGPVSAGNGGGNARLSSMVTGVVGSVP